MIILGDILNLLNDYQKSDLFKVSKAFSNTTTDRYSSAWYSAHSSWIILSVLIIFKQDLHFLNLDCSVLRFPPVTFWILFNITLLTTLLVNDFYYIFFSWYVGFDPLIILAVSFNGLLVLLYWIHGFPRLIMSLK